MVNVVSDLGPLEHVDVRLPESGASYRITRPTDVDRLIDAMADDPEEVLPHWAEVWPSGIALADAVRAAPEVVRERRVLELGCGLGVTAIAALQAGADLSVCDYAEGALALCRLNARENAGREPATVQLNWRRPSDAFLALAGDGFPVVLAADILYEARDIEPLLALAERVVAPGGLLWLAEPGRPIAREFVSRAESRGWHGERREHSGPWHDARDASVRVVVYRLVRDEGRGRRNQGRWGRTTIASRVPRPASRPTPRSSVSVFASGVRHRAGGSRGARRRPRRGPSSRGCLRAGCRWPPGRGGCGAGAGAFRG